MKPKVKLISRYRFCVAHRLFKPEWTLAQNQNVFGMCANTHGHDYLIELHLIGLLNETTGMVLNEFEVQEIVNPFFKEFLDHKYLNEDVPFFKTHLPTAEWISVWLFQELAPRFVNTSAKLEKVAVGETQTLMAVYGE